jgi:hypothetical protein
MKFIPSTLVSLLLVTLLISRAPAQRSGEAPLSAEDSLLVTATAKVHEFDPAKREITLMGPLGNEITFTVDQRVKRLDEIKIGDEVTVDYYVSLAGELRAPTEEEKKNPVTVAEGRARAPKGTEPAGGGLRVLKIVTTVEGLDLPTQSLTLKGQGPLHHTVTVRARSIDNLKKLRLGDTIVVMYTEALAVSLQKVAPR